MDDFLRDRVDYWDEVLCGVCVNMRHDMDELDVPLGGRTGSRGAQVLRRGWPVECAACGGTGHRNLNSHVSIGDTIRHLLYLPIAQPSAQS